MSATETVERAAVSVRLPEARRYFSALAARLTDPDSGMASYTLTGADGQRLKVLLQEIEQAEGPIGLHLPLPDHA